MFCPGGVPPLPLAFTSPWCPIDLPCETHASVLLSPPHPLPSPVIPLPPRPSLLIPHLIPSTALPPHTENDQPSLVWFDRGKFYLTFEGKFALHRGSVHEQLHSSEAHLCKLRPSSALSIYLSLAPNFHRANNRKPPIICGQISGVLPFCLLMFFSPLLSALACLFHWKAIFCCAPY